MKGAQLNQLTKNNTTMKQSNFTILTGILLVILLGAIVVDYLAYKQQPSNFRMIIFIMLYMDWMFATKIGQSKNKD